MAALDRGRSPEKRRDRVRLSALDPVTEGLLAGFPFEIENLHELRAFAKHWVRLRNQYDIHRRRGGMFGARLSKGDAPRELARALAELESDR